MVGPGLYVFQRQGVHHPRHRGLPGARLRSHRLLRGRYRRTARLDRTADRKRRAERPEAAARTTWGSPTGRAAGRNARARRCAPHAADPGQEMRRLRRVKILATLGPASSDVGTIRKLFEAGADVFRINMSHTSHDKMRELVGTIRNVETSYGRPIGILVDLQGPKLRVGTFADGGVQLNNGDSFSLDSDPAPGTQTRVQLPHPEILAALRPGHALLVDDGKVRLIAEETLPERVI